MACSNSEEYCIKKKWFVLDGKQELYPQRHNLHSGSCYSKVRVLN